MDDIFKSYLINFSRLDCQPIVPTKIKISAASVQFSKIAGNGWGLVTEPKSGKSREEESLNCPTKIKIENDFQR